MKHAEGEDKFHFAWRKSCSSIKHGTMRTSLHLPKTWKNSKLSSDILLAGMVPVLMQETSRPHGSSRPDGSNIFLHFLCFLWQHAWPECNTQPKALIRSSLGLICSENMVLFLNREMTSSPRSCCFNFLSPVLDSAFVTVFDLTTIFRAAPITLLVFRHKKISDPKTSFVSWPLSLEKTMKLLHQTLAIVFLLSTSVCSFTTDPHLTTASSKRKTPLTTVDMSSSDSNPPVNEATPHHPFCDLPGDPSLMLTTNVDLGAKKLDVMKGKAACPVLDA